MEQPSNSIVNQWIKRKLFSRSTNVGIVFNTENAPVQLVAPPTAKEHLLSL